jgi:hypothetical protein
MSSTCFHFGEQHLGPAFDGIPLNRQPCLTVTETLAIVCVVSCRPRLQTVGTM